MALRRARIARPERVRIRTRNPWVFARLRVFGWKVRFDIDASEGDEHRLAAGPQSIREVLARAQTGSRPRKCVKRTFFETGVEKAGAIFRRAFPTTAPPDSPRRAAVPASPRGFPHLWKRAVE